MKGIGIVLLFLLCAGSGCKKEAVSEIVVPPVSATLSVIDTVSYAFTVQSHSFFEDRTVLFTRDTVLVRLSVTSFGGGSGSFTLYDASHTTISSYSLVGVSSQNVTLAGRPSYCSLSLDHWSGAAAILVTGKVP